MLVTLAACGGKYCNEKSHQPRRDAATRGLLTTDTVNIQDAIAKVAGAGSIGAGQPELTALIAGVNGLVTCYQKRGGPSRGVLTSTKPMLPKRA